MRVIAVIGFAFVLLSCRESNVNGGKICTTEARVGIQIEVHDALTGQPAAENAVATAREGAFMDTLRPLPVVPPQGASTLLGVYERAGVYEIIIKKSGYRDWIRTNVVVEKDECHVITVQLDARLERVL